MKSLIEAFDINSPANLCKGKIFRYNVNHYVSKRGEFVSKTTLTPAKKLSCKGCEYCEPGLESAIEYSNEGDGIDIEAVQNGDYVKLTCVCIGGNYEDMYDEWEPRFVKYELKED